MKTSKTSKTRHISVNIRNKLFELYNYKCANKPNSNVIQNYDCPMWKLYNGDFDESGFEIDHINEFSHTFDNKLSNLQILCICCHKVKTKKFLKNKSLFTTSEIYNGCGIMDIENKNKINIFEINKNKNLLMDIE